MSDLDLLRVADPVGDDPTPAALQRARATLTAATRAGTPYDVLSLPARRSHRRRWSVAVASVAAAAAALLVVPVLDSGPAQPTSTATAAQAFLLRSAEAVAAQDAPDARDAPYWYVRSRVAGARADAGTREIWLGRTDPGVLRTSGGTRGAEQVPLDRASFFGLTWQELFDLPTDTGDLRAEVYRLAGDAGPGPDAEAFVVIGDLLRESPAPPPVRAALLRVAATIPGVVLGARTTDSEGRAVVPVSRTQPGQEHRLLMDPDDGRLLGEESISTSAQLQGQQPLPAGTVTYRSTTLAAGAVKDTQARL